MYIFFDWRAYTGFLFKLKLVREVKNLQLSNKFRHSALGYCIFSFGLLDPFYS